MREHNDSPSPAADASVMRIALAVSQYHRSITDALRDSAVDVFLRAGGRQENLVEFACPGSFELIAVCRALADERYDAIVALGCVISGETAHDQFINAAVSQGLASIVVQTGVPVAFGVLTCPNMDHARARAGGEKGNKGAEAMQAAIECAVIVQRIRVE